MVDDQSSMKPIHALEEALEATRLEEIERLATNGIQSGQIPIGSLGPLASVQAALMAVREEIAAHEIKLGGGSEKPLK